MPELALDDVDRGILYMLQQDARNNVASAIAEEVGVAPNTVRSRIERLESTGVIERYLPQLNYENAGYQLRVLFLCTVQIGERRDRAEEVLEIDGVVSVTEILAGRHNLTIEAIGVDTDDITTTAKMIEQRGIEIYDERLVKRVRSTPLGHFQDGVDGANDNYND